MQEREQRFRKIFSAISTLGAVFVLAELVLQFFGRSICSAVGCSIAMQATRFGEAPFLIIGLATFSVLALFSARPRAVQEPFINLVLIASLASEGFFIGYQAFGIHAWCVFCLIVFGLVVTLGALRLLAGEKAMIAGFLALVAVFSIQYLALPAEVTVNFPENERLVLFYSKDCKHCSEIMSDLKKSNLAVKHVDVNGYIGLLKSIGVEKVPTLLVNDPYQKIFLTGTEAIRRYLSACTQAKQADGKPAAKKKSGQAGKMNSSDLALDIFTQQSILSRPGDTATVTGACKEEEICK
jgi:hypothetical protein